MKQAKPNYKNILIIGLSAVTIVILSVVLYFYKLDADFNKPLSCERIVSGYLGTVHQKYNNHPNFDQIFRKATEIETQITDLCNTDISE